MNKYMVTACLLVLAGASANAQIRMSPDAIFDAADSNQDELVSREEFIAARVAQFSRLDRNGDGSLDDADMPKRVQARRQEHGGKLLAQFDANGDGRVSKDEFVNGPTPLFDQADANHDGQLDQKEVETARASAKRAFGGARP